MNSYILLTTACVYFILALYYYNRPNLLMLWLSYLPTLLHEFGHALGCQLTGGKVSDIVIVTRQSERRATSRNGYIISHTTTPWNRFATFIAGYLSPPSFLMIGVFCVIHEWTLWFWVLMGLVFTYYLLKTSRKLFPLFVLILLFGGCYFFFQYPDLVSLELISNGFIYILLGILLADTILCSYTITLIYFQGNKSWDGAMLSSLTKLPVLVYYLLFISFHFLSCWIVIKLLIGNFN